MNKKTLFCILFVLLAMSQLIAQTQSWSRIARGTNLPASVWGSGYLYFRTSDSTLFISTGKVWVPHSPQNFIAIYAENLRSNTADSAADTTAFYMPAKFFATGDTVTFSFSAGLRFTSLDSIIIIGGTTSSLGDSAAFAVNIKQVAIDSSYTEAFSATKIDTVDLGAGNIQKQWKLTSFGTLIKNKRALFTGRIWRSACANDAAARVYIFAVWIFGVGLL